jgi:glucose/arabinose dehydrogenase/chitodextrinase
MSSFALRPSRRFISAARVPVEKLEERTLFATVPAGFQYANYVTGLPECTSMTWTPDGRLFYTEKSGAVRVVKNGQILPTPLVKVVPDGYFERGLENITLDPDFANNGVFYLYYVKRDNVNPNTAPNNAKGRISRFRVNPANPDVVDPNTPEAVVVDNIGSDTGYHNGGFMAFEQSGPVNSRLMYVGVGEAGLPHIEDAKQTAQDLSTLNGKILRINPRAGAQLIPSDNPYVGQSGKRGEIYASGVRNPFTGNVKPGTNTIYFNDVGSNIAEEINQVARGANYGYPLSEGYTTNTAFTNPLLAYKREEFNSTQAAITGGVFYNGSMFPSQYQGKYFFADETNQFIRVFDPAVQRQSTGFGTTVGHVLDLDVGPDGALYGLTHTVGDFTARIVRISYVGSVNRAPTAVSGADKTAGALPLTVNFNGNGSSDPDGDALTYSWNFGDGTTGTGKTVSHTYSTKGKYNAVLTVNDGKGGSNSAPAIVVTPGNFAPVVSINAPANNSLYSGGDVISYSGSASDPEDGMYPASKFDWTIELHHEDHVHPFLDDIDGVSGGSFTIPRDLEVDPVQFFRIYLKVTDSVGVTTTSFIDIQPRKSTFTLASNVAGARLNLDGVDEPAGTSTLGVVGTRRRIEAPEFQTVGGQSYQFVGWSDGGNIAHDILTPSSNTTYTATYQAVVTATAARRAEADAYVRNGTYAGTNFGNTADLQAKLSATSYTRETYLRFNIADFPAITGATLKLFGKSQVSENVTVNLFAVANNAWSETGITWNNRPGSSGPTLGAKTIAGTTGQTYSWDVSDYVREQREAGATAVTFVVRANSTKDAIATFNSDEASSGRPELAVNYVTSSPSNAQTIRSTADTYVRDGTYASANFGAATELQLKKEVASYNREVWLKFDLSSVPTITSAKLRLFGKLDSTVQTPSIAVYSSSSMSWGESTLTWNTRPASGTSALATVTVAGSTPKWYEWDVTNYLKSEKALGHNLVTLVVRTLTQTTPYIAFNSDEAAANQPQLQIAP